MFSQPHGKVSLLDVPIPSALLTGLRICSPRPHVEGHPAARGESECSSPAPPVETNFYTTRINPAGKLQCCPDAPGSRDYDEVVGTDSGRERAEDWLCHCPDPPRHARGSLCLQRERGLWCQPHIGLGLPQTGASVCPARGWGSGSGLWLGSEGDGWACFGPSSLDDSSLLASPPAASPSLTSPPPHRGWSQLFQTHIRSCHLSA